MFQEIDRNLNISLFRASILSNHIDLIITKNSIRWRRYNDENKNKKRTKEVQLTLFMLLT